jgi:cytoskeleton protein RodZ
MTSVGAYLCGLRAQRGVSLEELARTTRVAPRYLEALEADAFDRLPAPVFTRGFIRAYCQALAQPPDEALACYEGREGRVPQPTARPPALMRARAAEPRARGSILVSFILVVVLGMALVTVAFVIQPRDRAERLAAQARPDWRLARPPAASPVTPPPASVASRPAPMAPPSAPASSPPSAPRVGVAPVPPPAPTPPLAPATGEARSPYRLVARTSEATWIRVRTEDGRSSEETVPAGEVREWVSDRPFVLTVGNAGGVSFELNGRALPPLGARGIVVPRLVIPPERR